MILINVYAPNPFQFVQTLNPFKHVVYQKPQKNLKFFTFIKKAITKFLFTIPKFLTSRIGARLVFHVTVSAMNFLKIPFQKGGVQDTFYGRLLKQWAYNTSMTNSQIYFRQDNPHFKSWTNSNLNQVKAVHDVDHEITQELYGALNKNSRFKWLCEILELSVIGAIIMWLSLQNQRPRLLLNHLHEQLKKAPIKRHYFTLRCCVNFLKILLYHPNLHSNLNGLKVIIKGKINRFGNARKRKFVWSYGSVKRYQFSNILHTTRSQPPTPSGTLGLEILINYATYVTS